MESIIGDESEQLTFFLTEFKSCIIEKLPTCLIDHKAELLCSFRKTFQSQLIDVLISFNKIDRLSTKPLTRSMAAAIVDEYYMADAFKSYEKEIIHYDTSVADVFETMCTSRYHFER